MSDEGILFQGEVSEDRRQSLGFSLDCDSLFGDPADSPLGDDFLESAADSTSSEARPLHQGDPNHGLRWISDGLFFSVKPTWTAEPTIDSIVLTLQKTIGPDKQYKVEHLWDGAYNKMYSVLCEQNYLVMRVSLPVCPKAKTESEVATLRWIAKNTSLPVPKVHHYDSSRNNPIGFEWILMDWIDGIPLSQCWPHITQDAKERIVKQIAAYTATAFGKQFRGIGNIYSSESPAPGCQPPVGEMIPFRTAFKWTERRLRLVGAELLVRIEETEDEGHRKTAARMLELVDRLRELEDGVFQSANSGSGLEPISSDESTDDDEDPAGDATKVHEPTVLWHDNLSLDNILVDENGILSGVIDWQCVSCLPLYEACQFPTFLQQEYDRNIEPLTPHGVTRVEPDGSQGQQRYDRDLKQHHITLLRKVYIDEMRDICPGWIDAFKNGKDLRDFEAAVQNCDNEFAYELVEEWLDAVERGENPAKTLWRLHVRLMGSV
ncbi:phosphotransferase enzyme family-domain-containing protein [Hypoxylon crocopeplum]|nr:phosphotransferase enzyme family-domain-containing protein [Hypoxylon crocopeplum]